MHFLFNKKTFLGLVGLLMVISLVAYPGMVGRVAAEGGNIYLPAVFNSGLSVAAGDTVIFGANATWKYFDKGAVPGSGWNLPGFNDSAWSAGSAPLGYGEGTERTVVSFGSNASNKYPTTYFRKTFSVTNAAGFGSLKMDLVIDDGAVIYLNGNEVNRTNMPAGTIGYSTFASAGYTGASTLTVNLDPRSLREGNNTLAVEVHQVNASSSDLAFGMILYGTVGSTQPPAATPVPTQQPTNPPAATPVPTQPPAPTAPPTVPPVTGNQFYVTTNGSSSGSGSASSPWSLAYAFGMPSAVRPGDTIWVRGGTYNGPFISKLRGSSSGAVTLRAYPGERAILRVTNGSPVIDIYGNQYVNYWGLEITGAFSVRDSAANPSTYGIRVNQGVSANNVKFINMIIHDVQAQGMGWWQALVNSEVYGSLIYFNGTTKLDHGVYVHNVSGTKLLANNIIFDNASHGVHGYAETAEKGLTNISLDGNTLFNNGSIGGTYKRNILVGGLTTTYNAKITNNYTYYPGSTGDALNLGYSAGSSGSTVTNNYFAGGSVKVSGGASGLTFSGNFAYAPGGVSGASSSGNTFTSSKPTGSRYFVRPNKYEPNRANITIYNWDRQTSIAISANYLSGVALKAGQTYELRNVQNYFGDVVTGVYDGSALIVPMTNHSVAQPVALSGRPASTFPEFGTFILIAR